MGNIFAKFKIRSKEFVPKSIQCFQEGYSSKQFYNDLFAGVCIGIIAIPLALAFAIASGVSPERGLFTAIVAGFLISLLGGSRTQIGGPTGAFVVLVYAIVTQFGYSGLVLATLIAALLLILMGIARLGLFLKYIPHPVIIGFTTGIAFVIFSSQIPDFFGLQLTSIPPECIDKWILYFHSFSIWNGWALFLASSTLATILALKRYFPRLPGAMVAIVGATAAVALFNLPVETIGSRFGEIPRMLPKPSLPHFSFDLLVAVFPSAITVALLGALESLLSASIADSATGSKHRSNGELIAQGLANLGSALFGGIPATGAIARTRANIQLGGKTPVAGMVHALTILILMLFFAPLVSKIPLCALAGVLMYVAWNMSELPHFIEILKGQKGDAAPLVITAGLTVLFDLTVAIQVGILLSALIFLKRMTDKTTIAVSQPPLSEVAIFELNGPLFYSVSHLLEETLATLDEHPKVCVLNLHKTPLIDATGKRALKRFQTKCRDKNISFLIAGAHPDLFSASDQHHFFPSVEEALAFAHFNSERQY